MRVYVAAPLARHEHAQAVARLLSGKYEITSSWYDDDCSRDPVGDAERCKCIVRDAHDIAVADVLVALCQEGMPRATYGEIGYALGLGRSVVWVHGPGEQGRNVWDSFPGVTRIELPADTLPVYVAVRVHGVLVVRR